MFAIQLKEKSVNLCIDTYQSSAKGARRAHDGRELVFHLAVCAQHAHPVGLSYEPSSKGRPEGFTDTLQKVVSMAVDSFPDGRTCSLTLHRAAVELGRAARGEAHTCAGADKGAPPELLLDSSWKLRTCTLCVCRCQQTDALAVKTQNDRPDIQLCQNPGQPRRPACSGPPESCSANWALRKHRVEAELLFSDVSLLLQKDAAKAAAPAGGRRQTPTSDIRRAP